MQNAPGATFYPEQHQLVIPSPAPKSTLIDRSLYIFNMSERGRKVIPKELLFKESSLWAFFTRLPDFGGGRCHLWAFFVCLCWMNRFQPD